jgi:lipopolysaccharide export LptBFGC system permease protein LptF
MKRRLLLGARIDRYVAAHFVGSYATALLLVVGLFWVMDMASNLDDFLEEWEDGTRVGTPLLVRYYLLHLPFLFLQVAPFVTLLAGMFTLNRLLKHNEVVAMLGAGVSAHRLLLPVLIFGALLAAGMFGLRELAGARLADARDALLDVLDEQRLERVYADVDVHDLSGSIVFLKDYRPADGPGAVPRAGGLVAIVTDGEHYVRVEADGATWNGAAWELENGIRRQVGGGPAVTEVSRLEGFEFTPELALTYRRARANPLELSFREVQQLIRREPDAKTYRTLWHYHLTFPLANLVLLLVGLPVLMQHERGHGADRLAIGGMLCIFYFAIDFVFRNLGLQGGLSPLLAGWVPLLLFGSLGVVLFDSMRS